MSTTSMLRGNALTEELWAKKGFVDMYHGTCYGRATGRGSIFQALELIGAAKGDKITYSFTSILKGIGIGEGGTQVGNEEALGLDSHAMVMNVFRHAVNNPNDDTIEQQRTSVPFESRARQLLTGYHGSRLDASFFNQAAGVDSTTITVDTTVYSGTNKQFVQGLNTVSAPSTNRITRAGGAATDEALTSSDTFTLDLIADALVDMQSVYPSIEPLEGGSFDCYMSPAQARDLKNDTTGAIQFYQLTLSEMEGGARDDVALVQQNGFEMKPFGKYLNVNLLECVRVATGQNSSSGAAISTVQRAVILGKNALAFASSYGRLGETVPLKYKVELQDYEYYKGIEARMLYGLSKVVFDGEDYGVHVISTYGA